MSQAFEMIDVLGKCSQWDLFLLFLKVQPYKTLYIKRYKFSRITIKPNT